LFKNLAILILEKLSPFVAAACQGGEFSYRLTVWSLITKKIMLCDEGMIGAI
jgi:hypothetical protein